MNRTLQLFSLLAVYLGLASPTWACSVCAIASDQARYAYYGTTALLSLLPLSFIGAVVYYIIRKSR